ncbi:MAG: hypothetical protein WC459_01485 [Patescibacteria group bacterium]
MKLIVFIFMSFLLGCGGEENLILNDSENKCVEHQVVRASKRLILIKIYIDPSNPLQNDFVLNALNSMWREVGVTVIRVPTIAEAAAGFVFVRGVCATPVISGRLQSDGWNNLTSVIVDQTCFKKSEYMEKFPAAVSFALGTLMGVEPYPDFCSDGVMSERVGRMQGVMPKRLSIGDKEAFYRRSDFSPNWEYVWECYKKPSWEPGEYVSADFRTIKFWADPALSAVPIQAHLNKYFKIFGRKFESADEREAEFAVKVWEWPDGYTDCTLQEANEGKKKCKTCSPAAIAYINKQEIRLKPKSDCLEFKPDSEWDATIISHEVAHLFGVSHVPSWCGNAIMDPQVNPGPYFTSFDVKAWRSRSSSNLDKLSKN